jgi:DNA (cytosine-5)-methyltransferase 1
LRGGATQPSLVRVEKVADERERPTCHDHTVLSCDPILSLFSGIGGIEAGLAQAGLAEVVGFCESWSAAQTVLRAQHPAVPICDDIAMLDDLSGATLVTAGFPCTDLSQAGRTAGLDGLASGLVRQVLSLVATSWPDWLLIENVPNMLHLGAGRAMTEITEWLSETGYSWAYRVMDSRAFGLPQRRRRVYLLASLTDDPGAVLFREDTPSERADGASAGAWSNAFGFYWTEGNRGVGWAIDALPTLKGSTTISIPSPPAAWLPGAPEGHRIVRPSIESAERLQGFNRGWTAAAPTRDRWKLVGNAVSVPAARWIGEGLLGSPDFRLDSLDHEPLKAGARWPSAAYSRDGKSWRIRVSEWPTAPGGKERHLATVLKRRGCEPLSHRATRGFRDRLLRSNLRYDADFMTDLDLHVKLTQN